MRGPADKPAQALESLLLKQILESSNAFKPTDAAGSKLVNQMFTEAMADAIAKAGGLGIAKLLEHSLPGAPSPVASSTQISSGFGARIDPISHQFSQHPGVDLRAATGTEIPAAADGIVISAGPRGGYGNAVELAHPDGTHTLYAHASALLVQPGDQVRGGEAIAKVGETGRATGPHLHFELRKGGVPVDPSNVLKAYRFRAEETDGGDP